MKVFRGVGSNTCARECVCMLTRVCVFSHVCDIVRVWFERWTLLLVLTFRGFWRHCCDVRCSGTPVRVQTSRTKMYFV